MTVSQEELNQYIKNMYADIGLPDLEKHHAGTVKKYLIDNLSMIGRYSHRDFERFGNLEWQYPERIEVHGRQDGWQALTKEVPHLDHLTYGTGILYIQGEMEIPPDEDDPVDPMINDEHYHVNREGDQYVYKEVEDYDFWNDDPGEDGSTGDVGEKGPMGPNNLDPISIKTLSGYRWEWITETPEGDDGSGLWTWATIKENQYGKGYDPAEDDKYNITPSAKAELPPKFNDDEVYNLDNERHHYPFKIINSGQAKSVNTLLTETLAGNNGMYDGEIPKLADGTGWPPRRHGIKYPAGHEVIVDFISPIEIGGGGGNNVTGGGGKKSKEYRDAFFFRNGIAVNHPETFPPNELPPEERRDFYDKYLWNDQVLYDDNPDNDWEADLPNPALGGGE